MSCVKLDSDEVAAYSARRDKRGAGAAEGVKHKAMRLAEGGDQWFERLSRLLRRMITSEIGRTGGDGSPFARR